MKVAVFSAKSYDRQFLTAANADSEHEWVFFEVPLDRNTAEMAVGFPAVCVFVNDELDEITLKSLADHGTQWIALRCTGFNNVDLKAANRLGIRVARVSAYSPYAVAEYTVGLILTLNRKIHRAYNRVREGNFALEGLLGFDLHGRTVGVVGTGKIGLIFAQLMQAFGCQVLAYDPNPNPQLEATGVNYVPLSVLFAQADIISLHCPLTATTHHLINAAAIASMKPGVILINTSRGGLIDTQAVIDALKSQKLSGLGLDVYEQESDLFFEDLSNQIIQDDLFERLLTFPNVIVTGHQAFFTADALQQIAETTVHNLSDFAQGRPCPHQICYVPPLS
jgi:D-lactate dehydrogenase